MRASTIAEFLAFQAVWFACVLGAARELGWIGCAVAAVFTAWMAARAADSARAAIAFTAAGIAGASVDALLSALGWIVYADAPRAAWAPLWITALWIAFAATLSSSMSWLRGRPWLSIPFAALGAPLSYLGAERLSAVAIGSPRWPSLAGAGVLWIAGLHGAQWIEARLRARPVAHASSPRRTLARRPRRAVVAGSALVLALFVTLNVGCTSMDKHTLETRLLALEKNAPVRAAGLQALDAQVMLAGETVDAQYRYHRAGEHGKPVIVLLHGTPSSLFTWTELVHGSGEFEGLATDFEVFALEALGHGTTRTELDHYTFEHCADWVDGFLDALDLREVTLVGQSYGGEFAWRAALDRPERVARVVLMNSSGIPRRDGEWLPEEEKMREWKIARWGWLLNSRARIAEAVQPHFAEPVPAERLEEYFLVCESSDNWRCMVDLARDENGSRAADLAHLAQPVLLLWGARDIAYRPERYAAEFARLLPRARLVLVSGAGHYPHEERPADVAREIRAFVAPAPGG